MRRNIIDPESADTYIRALCADCKPELQILAHAALHKALNNNSDFSVPVNELPADAPNWLHSKWPEGGPYFRFSSPREHREKYEADLNTVIEWLAGALAENAPWLRTHCDNKGRPYRLLYIESLEEALEIARDDYRLEKERKANRTGIYQGQEEVVHRFQDGFVMVRLRTPEAMYYEGRKLDHCTSNPRYNHINDMLSGKYEYYSLRSPMDTPHATLMVDPRTHTLENCVGAQNVTAPAKYIPHLQAFISEQKYRLTDGIARTGMIEKDGVYIDIYHLPEHFSYPGTLEYGFRKADWTWKALPVEKLPSELHVGQKLGLRGTPIRSLPKRLHVGSLDASDTGISQTPEYLHVEGDCDFRNTPLSALPEKTYIGGHLRISSGTDIPECAVIKGTIIRQGIPGTRVTNTACQGAHYTDSLSRRPTSPLK